MKFSIADEMLYCTVRISCARAGSVISTGTGFIWCVKLSDHEHVAMLITNKHVIANCDSITVQWHTSSAEDLAVPTKNMYSATISFDPSEVYNHPDPSIDICAMGLSPMLDAARAAGTPIFFRMLAPSLIPTDWSIFDSIEDVYMVGYPRGIWDAVNNRPIVRRGITATALDSDYNGKPEFMVDMACFPGSSGSPVFISQTNYFDRELGGYSIGKHRVFFVGILYEGPMFAQTGEIILGNNPKFQVSAMMHLGNVIKSSELLELHEIIYADAVKLNGIQRM